ncbi:MAG: glycoside hydrolase family 9 protein, partial [Deltaproteobacteria bacterium]|nr:glycoside hydrolase family 9 protein [Deltaproteobacteria bacterium]
RFPHTLWWGIPCLTLLAGCAEKPFADTAAEETITHPQVDTAAEGDGRVDNYDYASTDAGHFTELGVWEQEPEYCIPASFPQRATCKGAPGLWGKALQMALWFFNVNKSGQGVACTNVQWRGDAHIDDAHIQLIPNGDNGVNMSAAYIAKYRDILDPDGDGEADLSGGYYNAGDYIKLGLTTGYMVSTLSWALHEFPEAFLETGLKSDTLAQIRWAADYFMKNMFIENRMGAPESWRVIAYAHQVGDVSDHQCGWMPPELRDTVTCPRKGYFATLENPAADVTANHAAALALVSLVTADDESYAADTLNHAMALYQFAKTDPAVVADTTTGLYESEYAWDDLAWAATWLYEATGDTSYLDEALEWLFQIDGFDESCVTQPGQWSNTSACWTENWTHTWNSLRSGVFVRLAVSMEAAGLTQLPNNKYARIAEVFQMISRADSEAWLDPAHATPQGFSRKINATWGSGRYNAAGQLVALTYARHFPEDDLSPRLIDWARTQSRYLLGDNQVNADPNGKSFMMGFTDLSPNYASQPHHAAGHASIFGLPDTPVENRHILYGALVNGPMDNDTHIDKRDDYSANEVTIDLNAAFAGALAGNYHFQGRGQCPDPEFPPQEQPVDEFYTMGKINHDAECRSQITVSMVNESVQPPRFNEFLSARYYFDVTELEAAGIDPASVTASILYDSGENLFQVESPTTLSGPYRCEDVVSEEARHTWYVVLGYHNQKFWGNQQMLQSPRETLVELGVPTEGGCIWDPSNDWSHDGMDTDAHLKTPHITVYGEDSNLLWGEEPPCHPIQHAVGEVDAE